MYVYHTCMHAYTTPRIKLVSWHWCEFITIHDLVQSDKKPFDTHRQTHMCTCIYITYTKMRIHTYTHTYTQNTPNTINPCLQSYTAHMGKTPHAHEVYGATFDHCQKQRAILQRDSWPLVNHHCHLQCIHVCVCRQRVFKSHVCGSSQHIACKADMGIMMCTVNMHTKESFQTLLLVCVHWRTTQLTLSAECGAAHSLHAYAYNKWNLAAARLACTHTAIMIEFSWLVVCAPWHA